MRPLDECITAAVLLGMHYDTWTHSLRHFGGSGSLKYGGALDAETMEPFPRGALALKEKATPKGKAFGNFAPEGRVPGHTPSTRDVQMFERFKMGMGFVRKSK